MANFVAVEFDVYDVVGDAIVTRYLCSAGPLYRASTTAYEPRLTNLPIMIGVSLAVELYGQTVRGAVNAGRIEFLVGGDSLSTNTVYDWFTSRYHWLGHDFRVYESNTYSSDISDYTLVYTGRIADISMTDTLASITTTDASSDLDGALVDDFYDSSMPAGIAGQPRPYQWGRTLLIEPVLEVEATLTYRVSARIGGIADVTKVTVGGLSWNKVTSAPRGGQWCIVVGYAGLIQLGAVPLGGEIRADVNSFDYATMDTAALMSLFISGKLSADATSMSQLSTDYGALVGYWTSTNPVNRLDAMDDVMRRAVGWWYVGFDEKLRAGVIKAPGTPTLYLNSSGASASGAARTIHSVKLMQVIPPAWRVRVEFDRNWVPNHTFYETVADNYRASYSAAGEHITDPAEDTALHANDPRAVDMELIRALCLIDTEANAVRDRVAAAFSVQRFLFQVEVWIDAGDIELYDTVQLTYGPWDMPCRVHGLTQAFGGGAPSVLQLWG